MESSEDETNRYLPEFSKVKEFPNREPRNESEYPAFFKGLLKSNFDQVDSQTFKAYSKIVQDAPNKDIFNEKGLEKYFYCCVARADIEIKELFEKFVEPDSRIFVNLIPVLIWVLNSQKSKRFVEPLMVEYYEVLRNQWKDHFKVIPFGKEFGRFLHQPITLEEKDDLMLFFMMIYWKTIENASNSSIKVFLDLVKELVTGVRNPPPKIAGEIIEIPICLQARITSQLLKTILCTLASISSTFNIKETLNFILSYSAQEVLPEITILTQYLISHSP